MPDANVGLSADNWQRILHRLGELLAPPPISVTVIGGVAMALTFEPRRTTTDIDVVIDEDDDRRRLMEAAELVRPEFDLPTNWLNEDAKHADLLVLERFWEVPGYRRFQFGNLILVVPSLFHMTAMKLSALRSQADIADIKVLLGELRAQGMDLDSVQASVGSFMKLAKRDLARYDLADLWEALDEPA